MYNYIYIYTCSERGLYAHRCTQYFVAAYGCMNISNMYTHIYVHKYTYHIYIIYTIFLFTYIHIYFEMHIHCISICTHIYIDMGVRVCATTIFCYFSAWCWRLQLSLNNEVRRCNAIQ